LSLEKLLSFISWQVQTESLVEQRSPKSRIETVDFLCGYSPSRKRLEAVIKASQIHLARQVTYMKLNDSRVSQNEVPTEIENVCNDAKDEDGAARPRSVAQQGHLDCAHPGPLVIPYSQWHLAIGDT
jgi:hypothetical protein